jgi:hypothetical protein
MCRVVVQAMHDSYLVDVFLDHILGADVRAGEQVGMPNAALPLRACVQKAGQSKPTDIDV